ncbi:hypothetical protein LMG22037_03992 [Paraburkholderia phenoliruptrix]|uniref:Helicase ATP-binding domain-containing protein n=1 Tax=Paraburkholderia phenoliruptrix TaxID=252970 RepID=A0A6J5BMP6_9BURK|nr:DEAD/DEAH box helicase family protein [Paraburkholderia phenoliruptrix]CAB3709790.1 hypothetical protein LMG22037_03992 [Paraburkholderia phenoliruptrix]
MFKNVPPSVDLWKHQRAALNFSVKHLRASDEACLIRMPTGTGKTGVIACLTLLSYAGVSLIITPWANLKKQMISDLRENFWTKIGHGRPKGEIEGLLPSNIDDVLKNSNVKVIVTTFTTLSVIHRTFPQKFLELSNHIGLTVVDEGHYEPAVRWGRSVKALGKKTVLLTATPYRNDLKLFRISNPRKSVFQFTHEEAERNSIIRKLAFHALPGTTNLKSLCVEFKKFWDNNHRQLPASNPRAIVVCPDAQTIREAVATLSSLGLKTLGVHDQFRGDEQANGLYRYVPHKSDRKVDADIWVHQYKLMEGLDDDRICCIALFGPVQNDRKLIQQIGRALRRSKSERTNATAILVSPDDYAVEKRWNAYRAFEVDSELATPAHFRQVVDGLLKLQPPAEYFEGRFRQRFRPDDIANDPQVTIAPSVLIRKVSSTFDFDNYIQECTDTLNLEDAIILGKDWYGPCMQDDNFALWVYAKLSNSRLLERESFYEIRLEAHCAVLSGHYLVISDTSGALPVELLDQHTSDLGADVLMRLIDGQFRITNVSVNSAIPFDTVVRAANLRGHNLANIATSLTDRVQICRSATGVSPTNGRRYVGANKGRVRQDLSDAQKRIYTLDTFLQWAESVSSVLANGTATNQLFQRYMQTVTPPDRAEPRTISIDLLREDLELSTMGGVGVRIENSSANITASVTAHSYNCTFDFSTADPDQPKRIAVKLNLRYQPTKGRFWFHPAGETLSVRKAGEPGRVRSLIEYLNQNQGLILIGLKGGGMVYQGRDFYAVDYNYAERALINRITQPAVLACSTEKGTSTQLDQAKAKKDAAFPDGSLFKAIAEASSRLIPFDATVLICDDMGSEGADFIAADFHSKKIAFIHAKTGDDRKISAAAFHDIVAQALKNLAYLSRNPEQPKGAKSWRKAEFWNNTGVSSLLRAPTGSPEGDELWEKLKSEIIESSDAELHVILVTAGCCDIVKLREAVHDPKARTAETGQLLHLLEGLSGYARQLGVGLTVHDVPFKLTAEKAAAKEVEKEARRVAAAAKKAAKKSTTKRDSKAPRQSKRSK